MSEHGKEITRAETLKIAQEILERAEKARDEWMKVILEEAKRHEKALLN